MGNNALCDHIQRIHLVNFAGDYGKADEVGRCPGCGEAVTSIGVEDEDHGHNHLDDGDNIAGAFDEASSSAATSRRPSTVMSSSSIPT